MTVVRALAWAPWRIKACVAFVVVTLAIIVLSTWVMPYSPNATDLSAHNLPPAPLDGKWSHPLGTDQLGRDLLSRTIFGLKVSVGVASVGILVGCVVGVTAGLLSGYIGGIVDKLITAAVDFQFAVPYTLMILMGLVLLGTDIKILVVMLGLAYWENYARVIRSLALSLRVNQYIEAAEASGASRWYIISKHIFPNVLPTVVVMLTLYFPAILTLESSLSFLGIGIQPPTASLGKMVGEGRNYLITSWWISLTPALVILVMALVAQTLGDWLKSVTELPEAP